MRKTTFYLRTSQHMNNEYNPSLLFSQQSFRLEPGETMLFIVDCQQVIQPLERKDNELVPRGPTKLVQMCLLVHNVSFNKLLRVSNHERLQNILSKNSFINATLCQVDYNDLINSSSAPKYSLKWN